MNQETRKTTTKKKNRLKRKRDPDIDLSSSMLDASAATNTTQSTLSRTEKCRETKRRKREHLAEELKRKDDALVRLDPFGIITFDVMVFSICCFLDNEDLLSVRSVSTKAHNVINHFITESMPRRTFDPTWFNKYHSSLTLVDYLFFVKCKRTMIKTTAKDMFRITDKQCNELPFENARNPHYRSAAPMVVFDTVDVFQAAIERHKSVKGIQEYQDKLKTRGQEKKHRERQKAIDANLKVKERRIQLIEALRKKGVELRSDSKLCASWIRGHCVMKNAQGQKQEMTMDQVVYRMCCVRFLFDHCPEFMEQMNELRAEQDQERDELRDNWDDSDHHRDYHATWDHLDFVKEAESQVDPHYPTGDELWPWQKPKIKDNDNKPTTTPQQLPHQVAR